MKNLILLLTTITFVACSPRTHYLGDVYPVSDHVDVYYDEGDIEKDFKVIGQLTGDNSGNTLMNLEKIKESMINEAQLKGADGIWFLFTESFDNNHIVKSKLIKYR